MYMSRQVTPRYLELAQALREQLDSYAAGDYLPSEAALSMSFGVNRHTLRRAVDELIAEGRVLRRKGRGTCVLPRPIIYPVHAASAYSKTLEHMGFSSEAIVLSKRKRAGTAEEAQALALADNEPVLEIETLRLLDQQPISLISHCFAERHQDLVQAYKGGSMRLYLGQQGVRLKRMSTLIGARAPSQRDALHLLMPRHTPVLSIRTLSCDADGASFELSNSITRADRFKYHVISGEQHEV
ncbi:phosphonate metabolism transcriptional regulator PhnF [Pusillimonas harenae]|uniref:Phosphonate metabolism transcriptional regulator PhnF n=2 Tax=Pollutimonas harenae TaxID=657015 RepID=A0A853GRW9_9BURK|nr:phosphonate metabolism transcriptional regulator PhnF [Pollutimonas harenae]TEA70896.1 phosphonate metabolism transcriptional regulator PhnF [Pollutimonas harenae]